MFGVAATGSVSPAVLLSLVPALLLVLLFQVSHRMETCVTCHVSRVTCHMSHVTCHMSRVTCHMSHVTCQVSHVTCEVSGGLYDDWQGEQADVCEALDQDLGLARSVSHCSTAAPWLATCSVAM